MADIPDSDENPGEQRPDAPPEAQAAEAPTPDVEDGDPRRASDGSLTGEADAAPPSDEALELGAPQLANDDVSPSEDDGLSASADDDEGEPDADADLDEAEDAESEEVASVGVPEGGDGGGDDPPSSDDDADPRVAEQGALFDSDGDAATENTAPPPDLPDTDPRVPTDIEPTPLADLPPMDAEGGDDESVAPEEDAPPPAPQETPEEFVARMVPVLEGMIFAADHPLTIKEILNVLAEEGEVMASQQLIQDSLEILKTRHAGPPSGLLLVEVANGYAFRTGPAAGRYLKRANQEKPFRMGRAALEALAIIAYRQPVTKAQIDELRGVDSSGALKALLDKHLVRVLGKAEEVGRPLLYGTTKTFLEAFNLKVLSDLPTLREYQELTAENQAKVDAQAPIQALGRIRDLAQPGARIVSEEAEKEGSEAMEELDKALGEATSSTRAAEVVLKAGGKLPPGMDLERITRPPPVGTPSQTEDGDAVVEETEHTPSPSDDEEGGKEEAE